MSKKSFRYRNQVTCPHCHQKYPTNSNYECPYCHTKFYDLSFVDLKTEDSFSIPFYVRYKCDGYTGFAEKPKEEYDVFITLATMGIRVENSLDYSYEKFSNLHGDFYGKYLKTPSFNVKAEMEALATFGENDEPVLFVAEAVPKKKK